MRRITLLSTAAAVALIATVPTSVSAADDAAPADAVPTDRVSDVELLRLDCRARVGDSGAVVRCDWSPPTSPAATAVRLVRFDPAVDEHRRVVYRSGDLGTTGYNDAAVRPGHRYAYGVVVVDSNGRVVARSRAEWVRVPSDGTDVEVVRLGCELGPAHEAIGCHWSAPHTPAAAVVTLWRSVDGGEREVVERFRASGPTAYRDTVPRGAQHITYAVIATDESGEIVARSRPTTVRITSASIARPADRATTERPAP